MSIMSVQLRGYDANKGDKVEGDKVEGDKVAGVYVLGAECWLFVSS